MINSREGPSDSETKVSEIGSATYTGADELNSVTQALFGESTGKASSFDYQRDGRLLSRMFDGKTTEYEHDQRGLATKITSWSGGAISMSYYDSGALKQVTLPTLPATLPSKVIAHAYDAAGRLRDRVVKGAGDPATALPLSSWEKIAYDQNDNRVSEVVHQRSVVTASPREPGPPATATTAPTASPLTPTPSSPPTAPKTRASRGAGAPISSSTTPATSSRNTEYRYTYANNRLTRRSSIDVTNGVATHIYDYSFDLVGNTTTEAHTSPSEITTNSYYAAGRTKKIVIDRDKAQVRRSGRRHSISCGLPPVPSRPILDAQPTSQPIR